MFSNLHDLIFCAKPVHFHHVVIIILRIDIDICSFKITLDKSLAVILVKRRKERQQLSLLN